METQLFLVAVLDDALLAAEQSGVSTGAPEGKAGAADFERELQKVFGEQNLQDKLIGMQKKKKIATPSITFAYCAFSATSVKIPR